MRRTAVRAVPMRRAIAVTERRSACIFLWMDRIKERLNSTSDGEVRAGIGTIWFNFEP
jgi:hypothetical protein